MRKEVEGSFEIKQYLCREGAGVCVRSLEYPCFPPAMWCKRCCISSFCGGSLWYLWLPVRGHMRGRRRNKHNSCSIWANSSQTTLLSSLNTLTWFLMPHLREAYHSLSCCQHVWDLSLPNMFSHHQDDYFFHLLCHIYLIYIHLNIY